MCTTPQHILVTEGDLKEPPHSTAVLNAPVCSISSRYDDLHSKIRQPI